MPKTKQIEDLFAALTDKIDASRIVDEDNMISNSQFLIPTQQSVKAYADTVILGAGLEAPFIEEIDEFFMPYNVTANTDYTFNLTYSTEIDSIIDISINGLDLDLSEYTHTIGTDEITINVPYPLDTTDSIKVIYKKSI